MGVARATRLQRAALAVLFAGIVAVPVRLAGTGSAERLRTAPETTTAFTATTSVPAVAPTGPPGVTPPDDSVAIVPPPADAFGAGTVALPDDTAAGVPIAFGQRAPSNPAPEPGEAPSAGSASNVYALVIGINDYPGTQYDLHAAVADAHDMTAALLKYGVPATNIDQLTDGAADAASIISGLRWLTSVAGPDSTVVLSYSGHARKLASTTEAIVSSDGVSLPDWYLARQLASLRAHDAWIVIAACYGAGFDELLAPGRILTAAADANGLAYESSVFQRSYLDEYLVRRGLLLGEAGGPTVQQDVAWAQSMLQRDAPDRQITEVDQSTGPISIDGKRRGTVPAPDGLAPNPPPGGGGSGGGPGGTGGGTPPTTVLPITAPPPKQCVLVVLCG